jgi:ribosome recycling factor
VDYFGAPTPLKQVASISVPDASTLLLTPFDKSSLKAVEKAINVGVQNVMCSTLHHTSQLVA